MKPGLLQAYLAMLPRLIAEEDLRAVSVSIAPQLKPGPYRTYINALERATLRRKGMKARTVGDLQKAGLAVVETARPKG